MASTTLEAATVATLSFLKPGSWPSDQKPYEMLYTPADGIPLINHETAEVCGIPIHDLRPRKDELSLDEEGFIISELKSQHQYEDLQDEEFLKTVFAQELRDHLLKRLGARALYIHECVVSEPAVSFQYLTTVSLILSSYGNALTYPNTKGTGAEYPSLWPIPVCQAHRATFLSCSTHLV